MSQLKNKLNIVERIHLFYSTGKYLKVQQIQSFVLLIIKNKIMDYLYNASAKTKAP